MPLIPDRLNYGDTIGIIAPASAPPDPQNIDRSVEALERLGFKPKLAPNARKRLGFLAGNDCDRARDLMRMFTDRKVKAIICVRGGYGTSRLLPRLDYRTIRTNPKIFVGYSDITSLHCAFLVKSDLVTFHGPMLNSNFVKKDMPDFTMQGFLRTLMQPSPRAASAPATGGKQSPFSAAARFRARSSAATSPCSAPHWALRSSPPSRTASFSSKIWVRCPIASTGC